MRTRLHGSRNAKTQPISLYPDQIEFARKKASAFGRGISLSKYFQALLEHDRAHDILRKAILLGGKAA